MNLELRIMILEKYFRAFRMKIGMMRQHRPSMQYDPTAIEMQRLCGDIETSLYHCLQLLHERR